MTITNRDPNGYVSQQSPPLQRLLVALGGEKRGEGLMIQGLVFDGNGATADLLCLANCQDLEPGTQHRMRFGRIQTHMRSCGNNCWDYDNLPYLWTGPVTRKSAWQILEVCSGGAAPRCLALSTVNSRE